MKSLILLCIIFILTFGKSFSQVPVLLPPFGHTGFASDFDINFESKTIASIGIDGQLIFWDIASQKAFAKIPAHLAECYSIRYSWESDYLITSSIDGYVKIWSKKGELMHEISTGSPNLYAEMDRTEKKIAVASADGHARVYEYPSLKLIYDIEVGTEKLNCAAFTSNGRVLFTGGDDSTLNAYDMDNAAKSMLNLKLDDDVKTISFDWAGSAMIIHTMSGFGEILLLPAFESIGRLIIPTIDYKSGAAQFASQMDISPDSKWLALGNALGQIQVVSGERLVASARSGVKFETIAIPVGHTDFIGKVKFSPDMKYLISLGHDRKFSIVEIKNVNLEVIENQFVSVKIIKQFSDYIRSIYFDDEKNIHIRGFYTYSWDLKTGDHYSEQIVDKRDGFLRKELNSMEYDGKTFYVDAKRDIILIEEKNVLNDPDAIFWSKRRTKSVFTFMGKVYLYDEKSKSILISYKEPWVIKPEIAAVSEDGMIAMAEKNEITTYDNKGKKTWTKKLKSNIYFMDISHNGLLAVGNYGTELPVFNLMDGKEKVSFTMNEAEAQVVSFAPDGDRIYFTGYYGGIQMATVSDKSKKFLVDNDDISVFAMCVSDDGKMIATVGYDRLIRLFSVETKKSLYDIFTMQENGMAIVSDDNYYMSDKKAYKELAFYYNEKVYTGDQFDAQYNRPDLVLNSSPYADASYVNMLTDAWRKRMKRLGIKENGFHDSKTDLAINNISDLKTNVNLNEILLDLKVTDSINKVSKLLVTLNDVPLYGRDGLPITHSATDKNTSVKLNIPLLTDKNIIKIIAIDETGTASLPEIVEINSYAEDKPELYLVTLGTSKYKDERFNLDYAAKDAGDVKDLFKSNKNYAKINSLSMTDEKVNGKSMAQIKTFLKKAKPTDVVMVFVAGHGLIDKDTNYYLATNETNFLNPSEGGIRYEEFEKMFDEVSAIRKTLMLDACHSGELDKDEIALVSAQETKVEKVKFRNSGAGVLTSAENAKTSLLVKELFADMRAGTGATVLSSAGGSEYAIESSEYKNGLFTYSMIDGLKNMKADSNGDGKVMLSELQQFVSGNVLQLSGGKQRPTSRVENLSMDFQVW